MRNTHGTRSAVDSPNPQSQSLCSEEEEARRTPVLVYVMTYMFPSITIGLVILKYHDNPDRVFVDNVVPLWCFIASTVVYWLVAEAMKKLTLIKSDGNWFLVLHLAALASGLLSVMSQISLIFLPYPESLVPLLIWIPMPVIFVTWPISHYMYHYFICPGIDTLVHKIRCHDKTEQQLSSPV
ncbi:hypothetical protein ABFS83_02G146700 [Erythranthe nasuta]